MDGNDRADSEKRSRLGKSPPAKRIKKVLKRNERDDLSLGTRLIMETGNEGKRRNRLIDRATRRYDLSPFRDPPSFCVPFSNFPYYERKFDRKNFDSSYIYIYIYIRKTKFSRLFEAFKGLVRCIRPL